MKKQIFILLISLITLLNFNVTELKANEKIKADSAIITFTETVHDYGTIKKDSEGTYDFTFKNTGKLPLVLSNVSSSCGCTTPSWPKEPITPGKTGVIKVKYNTGIIGGFQKSITVYSNAKTVVLIIKGSVQE